MDNLTDHLKKFLQDEDYGASSHILDFLVSLPPIDGSVEFYELAASALWKSGRGKQEAMRYYRQLFSRAAHDADFRQQVQRDRVRLMSSMVPLAQPDLRIAILCYPIEAVGSWDPCIISEGIGGSEEAVIYAGEALTSLGHRVIVYADPPRDSIWSLPLANPRYLPEKAFYREEEPFDLVIMWRRTDFYTGAMRGPVYFWPHDLPTHKFDVGYLRGSLFLSQYHRLAFLKALPELSDIPSVICGNGVYLQHFPESPKTSTIEGRKPHSCIYASNYSRGLSLLLDIWPEIRVEYPTATLDIYYGRQTWGNLSNDEMAKLTDKIEYLRDRGVTERGKVGHQELARIFASSSILAYPCISPAETFCITAVKAQVAGMIPVTTRIGALAETVAPEAPTVPFIHDNMEEYKQLLLSTLREERTIDRNIFVNFGRRFTWKKCTESWLSLNR